MNLNAKASDLLGELLSDDHGNESMEKMILEAFSEVLSEGIKSQELRIETLRINLKQAQLRLDQLSGTIKLYSEDARDALQSVDLE